jgi:hypothetical protein
VSFELGPPRAATHGREEKRHGSDNGEQGVRRLVDPLAPVPPTSNGIRLLLVTANTSMRTEPARYGCALDSLLLRTMIGYRHDRDGYQRNCRNQRDVTGSKSNRL